MSYQRVTPRARNGVSGLSVDVNLVTGQGVWINPPDRIAAVTVAVHISGAATYAIECTCSSVEKIGENGQHGYWDAVESDSPTYHENKIIMLANSVTGIRVRCISATRTINVCFVG